MKGGGEGRKKGGEGGNERPIVPNPFFSTDNWPKGMKGGRGGDLRGELGRKGLGCRNEKQTLIVRLILRENPTNPLVLTTGDD